MPPVPLVPGSPSLAARPIPLQRLRVLFALIVRDMNAKFGRSVGGYVWAIAEPLGGIILLAVAFRLARLLEWTASADIGVQPIRNTCLNHLSTDSNKLFEYAMAGLPVMASDFPEIRRVVRAHGIGLLFNPEIPGELAATLGRLVADEALRVRLAANARASARALSWEAQEGELVSLYERVLARS